MHFKDLSFLLILFRSPYLPIKYFSSCMNLSKNKIYKDCVYKLIFYIHVKEKQEKAEKTGKQGNALTYVLLSSTNMRAVFFLYIYISNIF